MWTSRVLAGVTGMLAALALTACVLPFGGGKTESGANPITGGEIAVSALPPAPGAAVSTPPTAAATATGAVTPAAPAAAEASPDTPLDVGPAAGGGDPSKAANADEPAAPAAAAPVPEAAKPAAQLACEKKKGVWSRAGKSSLHTCIEYTKDRGKTCRAARDCDSQCLARSGTCAPYKPLFGCNEILDDMGRRMTLCLD